MGDPPGPVVLMADVLMLPSDVPALSVIGGLTSRWLEAAARDYEDS
jgi:hypothetical protein